jgi:hypothetical protein
MWWSLATFINLQQDVRKNSGASNQDHQWSFGQVLGLASWVPVVVEVFYVYREKTKPTSAEQALKPSDNADNIDEERIEVEAAEEVELHPGYGLQRGLQYHGFGVFDDSRRVEDGYLQSEMNNNRQGQRTMQRVKVLAT